MMDYVAGARFGAADQATLDPQTMPHQETPAIASLESGGYVVSYIDERAVTVQRHDANGEKDGAPTVLTDGSSYTGNPSATGLETGGFAVTWEESTHVAVQLFDADGNATTDVFGVGGATNYQQQPVITALADGGFVVAWTFNSSPSSIRARSFDASGEATSPEIVVFEGDYARSYNPQIEALEGGGFVVSWSGGFDAEGGRTIRTRAYDAVGAPSGDILRIENELGDNFYGAVAALTSGHYVLTWTEGASFGSSRIMGQICDVTGSTVGERFEVNSDTSYAAGQSRVTALDTGGFLVTWRLDVPGAGPNYFQIGDVKGQLFDASGNKIGEEFLVNQVTDLGQGVPVVTSFGTGDVAVAWQNYREDGYDIVTRNFYSVTSGNHLANTLSGTAGIDILRGMGGDDRLFGGPGADILEGGKGDDLFRVDDPNDAAIERSGEGIDRVISTIDYRLDANVENLTLVGEASTGSGNVNSNIIAGTDLHNRLLGGGGDDHLFGRAGNDRLDGQIGADVMRGGAGDDVYVVGDIGDRTLEQAEEGSDTVLSSIDYRLGRNLEALRLIGADAIDGTGNELANSITGNAAANWLDGGAGRDQLRGGAGDDVLDGGRGIDTLIGGDGSDSFRMSNLGAGNFDRILNFDAADDNILLDRSVFTALTEGALAESAFQGGAIAQDADDRILCDATNGKLFYDADGSSAGAAILFAQVAVGTALTHADFHVGI